MHFGQEARVVLGMIAFLPAEAGGPDAGAAIQGVDLQSRVIGQNPIIDEAADADGLQAGVLQKGGPGFFDLRKLRMRSHVGDYEAVAEDVPNFRGFVSVSRGDDQAWERRHMGGFLTFFSLKPRYLE